jgi:hypothetical protein
MVRMPRSLSIFLWILIGALASGLGVGLVLHASNTDRQRLTRELQSAQATVLSLKAQQTKLTRESNEQVAEAAQQVARVETELARLQTLQSRFKTALPLIPPTAAQTRRWSEFASVAMGVSLRVPPAMHTQSSDDGLFVSTRRLIQGVPIEEQWFALTPYRAERETDIRSRLSNVSEVTYALGTRFLQGVRGTLPDGRESLYLLQVQENTSTTHLLWGKTTDGVSTRTILDTIATLSFR